MSQIKSQKTIILPKLTPWQEDVFQELSDARGSGKRVIVKSKRQVGKSILAEILLIKFCLEKRCTSIMLSPTLNQSRKVFKDINDLLDGSGAIVSSNGSLLTIEFANKSQLLFKSAEQRESLRGYTVDGILVIDEAAYIQDDIFDLVFPFVDANNAPMMVVSTPLFKSGKYYELYSNPDNITFDWSQYDTSEFLSSDRLEYYRKTLSENKFKSEYLGEFIEEGSFVFGNIKQCFKESTGSPVYCGIDWATGGGGDSTVVVLMDEEHNVTQIDAFNTLEPSQQIERIAKLINQTPSLKKIQVEMNSIGSVYYDYLRKAVNKPISKFVTTNDSKRRIIEQLAQAFNKQSIGIINDPELIKQLQHYAVEKTAKGYTYNGYGAHDDYVMALAICYDSADGNKGNYKMIFK